MNGYSNNVEKYKRIIHYHRLQDLGKAALVHVISFFVLMKSTIEELETSGKWIETKVFFKSKKALAFIPRAQAASGEEAMIIT